MAWMTAVSRTLQNSAILRFSSGGIGCSQRQSRMSGWMPMARSSRTLCWVGFVFISPAVLTKGRSVRWTKTHDPLGSSWPSWRMASKNGIHSMDPSLTPISTSTKSAPPASESTKLLISLVTWGITCTVAPR